MLYRSPQHASSSSIRAVSSVLESFDPSGFLNSLPANQIDDLENALLPHLNQQEDSSQEDATTIDSGRGARRNKEREEEARIPDTNDVGIEPRESQGQSSQATDQRSNQETVQEEVETPPGDARTRSLRTGGGEPLNLSVPQADEATTTSLGGQSAGIRLASAEDIARCSLPSPTRERLDPSSFSQLLPSGHQDLSAKPVVLTPHGPLADPEEQEARSPRRKEAAEQESATDNLDESVAESEEREYNESLVIDEERPREGGDRGDSDEDTEEISVRLDNVVSEGKSFKFAIPGSSKFVSLNFSADALLEMRNSVKKSSEDVTPTEEEEVVVTSSTTSTEVQDGQGAVEEGKDGGRRIDSSRCRRKRRAAAAQRKSRFSCPQCSKSYPSQSLLDRHAALHAMASNVSCGDCGRVFLRRWQLEQHTAVAHGGGEAASPSRCDECGKEFKWRRNLLAHLQLYHQKERRHRCRFCPLTFLQRKSYIKHQRSKHPKQPPTWCEVGGLFIPVM